AVKDMASIGVTVDEINPNMGDAEQCFQVFRNMQRVGGTMELLEKHRDKLSPEIIHYATAGLSLSARDIAHADLARAAIYRQMVDLFRSFDLLVTPTVIVPPFDVRQRHVMQVEGVTMPDFFAWLRLTLAITVTSCPALSLPCGFTKLGLPVGLQLIGKPRGEAALLAAASLFEAQFPCAAMLPIDPAEGRTSVQETTRS